MNDMPHPEVAQVRTPSGRTLPYRRLPTGGPYTAPGFTNRGETSRANNPHPAHRKKIPNYFRPCETPHTLCAPIQGEDMNIQSSSSSALAWRPRTAIWPTRIATNCNFLQEVAGICRIIFFETINTWPEATASFPSVQSNHVTLQPFNSFPTFQI